MSANSLSRRDFLKGTGSAAALLAVGCTPTREELITTLNTLPQVNAPPMVYPRLPDQKIQAPEAGCIVGFRKVYVRGMPDSVSQEAMRIMQAAKSIDDIALEFNNPKWDRQHQKLVGDQID